MTPEAQMRAAAERNMPVRSPPKIKLVRPLKCTPIAVRGGYPRSDGLPRRDFLTGYLSITARTSHEVVDGRRPAQSFLNGCLDRHIIRPASLAAVLFGQGHESRADS